MKWFILLMSTLTVVQNRPQNSPHNTEPAIELEKQTLIELNPAPPQRPENMGHPTQRNIEENTREILEKIAEVNKKQGLTRRKDRPNYFHFPFSYSRSQEEKKSYDRQSDNRQSDNRQSDNFKFPNNPFTNPIFEYLERGQQKNQRGKTNIKVEHLNDEVENQKPVVDEPAIGITKEDLVPNQYVKRKIVHQQTILMPNPNFMQSLPNPMPPQSMPPYAMQPPLSLEQLIPYLESPSGELNPPVNKTSDNKILSNLEKQTIDNVRNIVSTSQMQTYNPYLQYMQGYGPNQYPYGPLTPYSDMAVPPSVGDYLQGYNTYGGTNVESRQNWNWPGASYFPIYIRDPFLQIYNAVTSMIEYGPNAGQGGPCKRPNKNKGKGKEESTLAREAKIADDYEGNEEITFEIGENNSPQITINGIDGDKNNSSYLDIENIDIGANDQSTLKLTMKLRSTERSGKETESTKALKTSWDKIIESGKLANATKVPTSKYEKFEDSKEFRPPLFFKPPTKAPVTSTAIKQSTDTSASPPVRDSVSQANVEQEEDEKAEDLSISNDGNKKLFSRDNTGSGIFIHKLKVRKGGVAIAGPGGIATAGSGGTAIVGPNGVAYTHPDSLAIAGSGTKVVAVDPSINLGDLINNATNAKPSSDAFPPSRVGRVVAVGPVVYYNRGRSEKVTIIPFYGGGKGQALQIVENADGTVTTTIIKSPEVYPETQEEVIDAAELENPPLPNKYELEEFGNYIRNIQDTALKVVKLQEIAKQKGKLSNSEEAMYKEHMESLNRSASNLAKIQEESNPLDIESREGLSAWFERRAASTNKNKDKNKKREEDEKKKKEEEKKKKEEEERKKKEEERKKKEEEKRKEEEEKRKEEKEEEEEEEEDNDSITINLPPEDASVAEAKPVGLAVAGEGGVAASKPIATAVVGPGGLAIARPVGTAIAGVSPEQAMLPIFIDGYLPGSKPKTPSTNKQQVSSSEFLSRLISKYHQN